MLLNFKVIGQRSMSHRLFVFFCVILQLPADSTVALLSLEQGLMILLCLKAATKKQKYEKISEKKSSTTVESLCKVSRSRL